MKIDRKIYGFVKDDYVVTVLDVQHKVTYLDDYAYYLYLTNIYTNICKQDQNLFVYMHITENIFNKYYLLALKKIRIEKIKELLKNEYNM